MGYTMISHSAGLDVTDYFRYAFRGKDRRVIAGYTVRMRGTDYQGCWYGLYEIDETPKRIVALVCPIDNFTGREEHAETGEDFGYKDMDESCGPFYYDMPASLFRRLTPLDNPSRCAMKWRKKVARQLRIQSCDALKQSNQLEFAFE